MKLGSVACIRIQVLPTPKLPSVISLYCFSISYLFKECDEVWLSFVWGLCVLGKVRFLFVFRVDGFVREGILSLDKLGFII